MQGKHLALFLLGAIVLAVGFVFWLGASGGPGRAFEAAESGAPAERPHATPYDGGPIQGTIVDRRVRDELRRRIFAAWSHGRDEPAAAGRQGPIPAMPTIDGGSVDPNYIRSVFREDMQPMAIKCYEELLARQPDAGGRIEMHFKIIGDEKLGGFVEEAELDGGALGDPKMETCIRESLLSLSFRPPPDAGGSVTVIYPVEFASGEPDQ